MPAQAIALIVIKTVTTKGNIMKKYPINKDFDLVKFLTFPVIAQAAPIARGVLGMLVNEHHGDKYIKVSKSKIEVKGGKIDVLVFEPKNDERTLPALLYFHGGGFIYKAAPYHYSLAKSYARYAHCKVIMPDYRLTPDYPYPTAFNDCVQSLKWVINNANRLNIDTNKIAIGGDSAGGCLAAAVTLYASKSDINLCAQMLVYPVLDCNMTSESMAKYTDTPVWNSKLSKKMWELYLKDSKPDEFASPALAQDFKKIPKTYIETAEYDSLHDEGIEYANKLKASHIDVELFNTIGTMHGFDMAAKSKIVIESIGRRTDFLRRCFR